MKSARQSTILRLIEGQDVRTQEELAELLRERGIAVTQATISRDIKELRLLKVLSAAGGYKYATAGQTEHGISERFVRMFVDSVLSIDYSGNIVILRTLSGSANVAGEAIDGMRFEEILGTISGDNTIFILVRNAQDAPNVAQRLRDIAR